MNGQDERTPSGRLEGSGTLSRGGVTVALLLAGCQVFPEGPPVAATYDLGAGERGLLASALAPARVTVSSPAWLQATTMHYRVVQVDPGRRRVYADNRWIAHPPAMLEFVLERALGAGEGEGCRLQVRLDEFEQVFLSSTRSEARMVVRFALLPARGTTPLAHGALTLQEPTVTTDARGGVDAFRVVTGRLADGITQWLVDTDRALPGGFGAEERCRR